MHEAIPGLVGGRMGGGLAGRTVISGHIGQQFVAWVCRADLNRDPESLLFLEAMGCPSMAPGEKVDSILSVTTRVLEGEGTAPAPAV